jgi:hypothetical protein
VASELVTWTTVERRASSWAAVLSARSSADCCNCAIVAFRWRW